MLSDDLTHEIERLVDHLRRKRTSSMSLLDVAAVTEVLIGTMQAYFRSIDTSIYRECRALSEYISNARKEIASLQPSDLENARIPRAGMELDAIVQQTEEATNTIMEAAEEIMALDPSDMETYQATTQDAVMRIFEACSFQDITGQRISKVVSTLSHIEIRVLELRDLMGVTEDDIRDAQQPEIVDDENKSLLSGPALKGEGIDQTAVDALMTEAGAAPEKAAPVAQDAAQDAPEPKAAPPAETKADPAPAEAPEKAAAPKPAPPPQPEAPKPVDPAKLDAMFEEDFDPLSDTSGKEDADEPEGEAAKADEAKPAKDKKAESAPAAKDADLPSGEEVSQDDIDALFG